MGQGAVIAGRFELEALAVSGGMGSIFRARDRDGGGTVAVKLLRIVGAPGDVQVEDCRRRFAREAHLLCELAHPHVVRHVAHGVGEDGEPYLAMEWLDGEDLAHRLRRGPLDEREARTIGRAIAEALAHAHGRGIVHRDLKPGNVFLVDGDPARVKLIDFGVAHAIDRTSITKTGGVLGTPGYMSPEQVRGETTIDPRADLFALGCVLHEALAGKPAFAARDALALLFKILVDEPAAVHELRPEIPAALGGLIARLMAKLPARRPASAAAVAAELAGDATASVEPAPVAPTGLTGGEQRLICAIVGAPPGDGATGTRDLDPNGPTVAGTDDTVERERVKRAAAPFGASVEWLADGGLIAVLRGGSTSAGDQAARAARCALAVHAARPELALAIGTGVAEVRAALPVGAVVDRAVALLRQGDAGVVVDDTTARLLELTHEVDGGRLVGAREAPAAARTLLGRPSPCVGRDRELAHLRGLVDAVVDDRAARAALITGPAGIGKSRLVHELLAGVRARGDVAVWFAGADPVAGGAPLSLIAQLVRCADEPAVEPADRERVATFLAELRATAGGDGPATVRGDPGQRAEQVRRGFVAWLGAACRARPVTIVVDDLHWADAPSLRFLDAALSALADAPLLVVGVARPEVKDLHPRLWAGRHVDELGLPGLRPRAAGELARRALGDGVDEPALARLIARADGNPFFLEELVRAVAAGRGDALPETVLAMALARLETLEPAARQVLRAGSVYGESFTPDGAAALLDDGAARRDVDAWLAHLVEREVIDADATTYRFRHAYLRDAAYSMLTDADRTLGHRLAGEHLERAAAEPAVIAEHYERAGDPRAAAAYFAAARQVLRRSDPEGAIVMCERGLAIAGDVPDKVTEELRRVLAGLHVWRGDFRAAGALSSQLMAASAPGSKPWWNAAIGAVTSAVFSSEPARLRQLVRTFCTTPPAPDAFLVYGRSVAAVLPPIYNACLYEPAEQLYQRFVQATAPMVARDPIIAATLRWLTASRALVRLDDPWLSLQLGREAVPLYEAAGDTQRALHCQGENAMCLGDLGDLDAHRADNHRVLSITSHMGLGPTLGMSFMAFNLAQAGRLDEAREDLAWPLRRALDRGFVTGEGLVRAAQSAIRLREGAIDDAEREGRRAVRLLIATPRYAAYAFGALVDARLAQGRADAALRAARIGMALLARQVSIGPTEAVVRLAYAEALHAASDLAAARAAIADAAARVRARAERITDAAARATYLTGAPWAARTLALASAW